jgi:hypothetical protein
MTSTLDEFDLDIRIGAAPTPQPLRVREPETYTGDSVCDSCGTTISRWYRPQGGNRPGSGPQGGRA